MIPYLIYELCAKLVNTMREAFLDFEWHVHPAYHWQDWLDARGKPIVVPDHGLASLRSPNAVEFAWQRFHKKKEKAGPVLGPVLDSGEPRRYLPMQREHAALFQTFAALDFQDREAILGFASTYGLLGIDQQEQGPSSREHGYRHVMGESHLTWAREICLMQEAMRLAHWRSAKEEAEEDARYEQYELDAERHRRERGKKLEWLFDLHLQNVQPRTTFEKVLRPKLSFAPLTLLAAMWLQLALALADDKQFLACKFCRRLFEVSTSPTGFRTHREFCTDSCKTKDYRRRKREALRLVGEKKPVREIAKQTNTKVATIRTWLKASKVRRKAVKGRA